MLTGLLQRASNVRYLLENHSTTILTGIGVGGTIATAVLSGRASFKAVELIAKEQHELEEELKFPDVKVEQSRTDKIKLVWQLYLPPVAMGITTVTCIIVANKISSKKIAALAVAGGISERALQEYKDKVVEKLGERQNQKIRDEIAQDRVNGTSPASREVVVVGTGEVLCYDMTTGRYFQSTMEEIKRAENKVNRELLHAMSCSASEFYDEIGLPPTTYSDTYGWNSDNLLEIQFTTVMSPDGRPCIAIDFSNPPIADYHKLWN